MKTCNPGLLSLLLVMLIGNVHAQDLQLQWAKSLVGTHSVTVTRSVTDEQGNLFIAGSFSGTADFDPGPGTATLTTGTSSGNGSGFFAKYNAQGNYVFAHTAGDSGLAFIDDIALDNNGNLYLFGTFNATNDFDPGTGVANLTSAGAADLFIASYDGSGNYMSATRIGGTSSEDAWTMTIDGNNNIYIGGQFQDTVDFDPGTGITDLISGSVNNYNGFIAKYTSTGNLVFASKLHSTGDSEVQALEVDAAGNIFAGGMFQVSVDLDPGVGTTLHTALAGVDGFWAKYDAAGNYISSYAHNGGINFLTIDGAGNFYIAGRIGDSMDADNGPGTAMLYSVNNFDDYFAKYDNNGSYLNARVFVSNSVYIQMGLTTNHENSLFMCGYFDDTADFNPGGPGGELISAGNRDAFITKFDSGGPTMLAARLGAAAGDAVNSISTDAVGYVWLCGNFNDTVDFDFESGTTELISDIAQGGFFAKYLDPEAVSVNKTTAAAPKVKAYGTDNGVIVDFTPFDKVNADVTVTNMLGQTVAKAKHYRNDMLKINIPDAAAQLYVVIINNNGVTCTEKVWVK